MERASEWGKCTDDLAGLDSNGITFITVIVIERGHTLLSANNWPFSDMEWLDGKVANKQ